MKTPLQALLVIPIKPFASAKGRLSQVLSPAQRAQLARECAERVVKSAGDLSVLVVTDTSDNNEVPAWAREFGAECLMQVSTGLNGAVNDAMAYARNNNFTHVLIAHSDVPLAHNIAQFLEADTVCIVPDAAHDGTNVLALPTALPFSFHYGVGSFSAHVAEAMSHGLAPRIALSDEWALDLDEPEDLHHPRIHEEFPWLTMN